MPATQLLLTLQHKYTNTRAAHSAGGRPADPSGPAWPPLQSVCVGDSGGPLVYNKKQETNPLEGSPSDDRLLALTSW